MKSFRTEIENPIVARDIIELEQKIHQFKNGQLDEDSFRSLRLARGVYGQRQTGVQMIRIKIPYGKLNATKLRRIAAVSDNYSTGRLHITTRQDLQIHHVSLDRTPALWSELEQDDITLREACGNTVRNVTASALSGIDSEEVFDVRPYAEEVFSYFLRNPICQEMGRKFKISFSNSSADTALSFMHDLGFIATSKNQEKGFKVVFGGGLGSQSRAATLLYEFLPIEKLIPTIEAVLRVFDRYGERANRMKARFKFLIKSIGTHKFIELFNQELAILNKNRYKIESIEENLCIPDTDNFIKLEEPDEKYFTHWKRLNVIRQKQPSLYAIGVKIQLGDFYTHQARSIAKVIEDFTGNELTLTITQNLIIRHVPQKQLPRFYYLLKDLNLIDVGFENAVDITACPGTDTCNLGIANSTSLAQIIEDLVITDFPAIAEEKTINFKISGCMNSCGQHMIATIGLQGMTIKAPDKRIIPATQILLGGGNLEDGNGRFADKVIKIPSKRVPEALKLILKNFQAAEESSFLSFYDRLGKKYFYDLLQPLTDLKHIAATEFIDWGSESTFRKSIGIGECAGIVVDLVSTLIDEAQHKVNLAKEALEISYADSSYYCYTSIINTSKAILISENHKTNSQKMIIDDFEEHFINPGRIILKTKYKELISKSLSPNQNKSEVRELIESVESFLLTIKSFREKQLKYETN